MAGAAAVGAQRGFVHAQRVAPRETFVRLLEGKDNETKFSFSRVGEYVLTVNAAPQFGWPERDELGTPVQSCARQQITVVEPPRQREFAGVRGQWWAAFRFPVRTEVGGSLFVGRLGVASTVEANWPRFVHPEDQPRELNRLTFAEEVRWRTSRGYLGASLRYFPDPEPNRDQWRVGFVAGEELPSLKGLPIWMVVDLRIDERRWTGKFWEPLTFAFAFRFDLPGSVP